MTDFLAQCTTSATGNPMLDEIRDKGAEVVLALYRLFKSVLVHAIDNDAVREVAEGSAGVLGALAAEIGAPATITFVDESAFVCGQLLRASRSTYESASELSALLTKVGVSECTIQAGVCGADLVALGGAFAAAVRDPERRQELVSAKIPHVTLRKVEVEVTRRKKDDDDLPIEERLVRLYATANVVMRGFYGDVAQGVTILPHKVKRLAQRFVAIGLAGESAMLGLTAMARAHRDDAGRSVQRAVLALAVGRQVTADRITLAQLVMSALLADVGRARVLGVERRDRLIPLPDDEEIRVPAAGALACVAMGGINPQNAARCVTVVETSILERRAQLGQPWNGSLTPLMTSQILGLVSELLDRVAPRDTRRALSPADALLAVIEQTTTDRALVRLLVRAVGLVPTGTVVELATGEWAVVAGPSAHHAHLPLLKVVTDQKGRALDQPTLVDAGQDPSIRIARIIEPDRARFNVARTLMTTS